MLSPQVCPRCHSPIKAGRLACARCGLALDPTTRVPSKAAPITTPLAASELPRSQQATPNRAIGGVLTLVLVLALVVAAGVTQMNSSADGSPTPVPNSLTASRTISTIMPPTASISSPTSVPGIQSPEAPPPTTPSLPVATAISTTIPASATRRATDTVKPLPSSTPAPTHTATPRPAIPPTTAPTQPPPVLTPTAPPPPPATPIPTPTPVPGIGGTVNNWNGWTVGLAIMNARQQINNPQTGVSYAPSGTFWLIWIDARNDGDATRSLGQTVDFLLKDNNGNLYTELSGHGTGRDTREIARIFGRDYLNARVAPGGVTRTLLVFDVPSGATPTELMGRRIIGGGASLSDPLRF
ncbi:MAG TPA: hypothetical protein VEX13_09135, partial [Chloroflexia bacterium]|nr:hypothetical protein [Chloroflexia bacterium]